MMMPTQVYNIFPHYLINGKIFEKFIEFNVFVYSNSLQLLYETIFILRKPERRMIKNVF
jgi:hypothetical protein